MKNILIVLFSSLFCQVFSQQNNNDSIKEKLIDTLYITSRINETTVEKSKAAVNIGDDKEFALKFDKTKSKCFLEKIIINVKNFEPNETTQNYLRLRFYSSGNNGSIGEILSNNELFVKLLKESKKNFQLVFFVYPALKIYTNNDFYIGITLENTNAENKRAKMTIYSSKKPITKMYIRNNKINYWPPNFLDYNKTNKNLFPSIITNEKCNQE